jgi:hypothetical protein
MALRLSEQRLRLVPAPPEAAPGQAPGETAAGARDVHPVLESLEQSRKSNSDNNGTVPGARPSWGRDQGHLVNQALDLRKSWFAN